MSSEEDQYLAKLIKAVHENSILWDRKNLLFQRKGLKDLIWRQLAPELGKTSFQIRHDWQKLRERYRQYLKHEMVDHIEPRWKFYNYMSFLRDTMILKNNKQGSSESESDMEMKTHLKKKATSQQISKNLLTLGSDCNSDEDFQNVQVYQPPLCKPTEQKEHDYCNQNRFEAEVDFDKEIKATKLTTKTIKIIKFATPQLMDMQEIDKDTNLLASTHSSAYIKDKWAKLNAESQDPKRGTNELVPVSTSGGQCDKNLDYGKSDDQSSVQAMERFIYESAEDDITISENNMSSTESTISVCSESCITEHAFKCEEEQSINNPEVLTSQANERIDPTIHPPMEITIKECQVECEDTSNFFKKKKMKLDIMEQKDDDYHFVISLLPYLRRLNSEDKLQMRINMMNAVMEGLE